MKFRKKPVVIDAMRYYTNTEIADFYREFGWAESAMFPFQLHDGQILIPTLEGTMTANQGDWIIRGVHNEFYPCKNEIFEKTYEPAE